MNYSSHEVRNIPLNKIEFETIKYAVAWHTKEIILASIRRKLNKVVYGSYITNAVIKYGKK